MKLEITNTEHNVEDQEKHDGEWALVSWMQVDATYKNKDVSFTMQHDCGNGFDLHEVPEDLEFDDDFLQAVYASTAYSDLCECDASYIKNLEKEELEDAVDYESIEKKSKKIASILDSSKNFDLLSTTLERAESFDIGYVMCSLQIRYDCSQKQSSDICDLFL